jgi:hypothetical protein
MRLKHPRESHVSPPLAAPPGGSRSTCSWAWVVIASCGLGVLVAAVLQVATAKAAGAEPPPMPVTSTRSIRTSAAPAYPRQTNSNRANQIGATGPMITLVPRPKPGQSRPVGSVGPAIASAPVRTVAIAASVSAVLDNIRNWIMGILAGLATVFLTIGGVRYVLAAGDPGQVQQAKIAFRSAASGYALAALAPLVVSVLKGIVGA